MAIPEGYTKLATVGIAYKGEYDSSTTYYYLNAVYYDGSTFVAMKDEPTGIPRNDGTNWAYLSKGLENLTFSASEATDTYGIVNDTVGETVTGQALVDKAVSMLKNKEDAIVKKTAFNKNYETDATNIKEDGDAASVGILDTLPRADHIHPHDSTKLDKTGDSKNNTVTFTESAARTALTSGSTHATLFGQIAKYLSDMKAGAFKAVDTTSGGTASSVDLITSGAVNSGLAEKVSKDGGELKDTVTTFTSNDVADGSATEWTSVSKLTTGEKNSSVLNKVSTMFKNLRYLYKLLGTTDISAIGDGTATGAISSLNDDLATSLIYSTDEIKVYKKMNWLFCHISGLAIPELEAYNEKVICSLGITCVTTDFAVTDRKGHSYLGLVNVYGDIIINAWDTSSSEGEIAANFTVFLG